ncbi:MAG: asparaginase [Floccifex sp.]
MKNILIVATGGTIAGTGQHGKTVAYHAGEISVEQIIESIPSIQNLANIRSYQLFNIDSNEMDETHWIQLSNTINAIIKEEDIDGIVITHGTDLIEETAYYLNLTINTDKPIVLTGAMRPATATSADGPFNLYQAVSLAAHDSAYNKGVMVLFSSTIYAGRDIYKINNYKIDAFGQKTSGCLGYMQDEKVYFFSDINKKHTNQSIFAKNYATLPKVAIVYYYGGAPSSVLYDAAKENQGIVIIGSGSGNYNKAWLKAINELSEKGILFVRSSRVSEGIVFNDEIFDPKHNCVPANTLSGAKARILLMLSLSITKNKDRIQKIFEEY